MAERAGEIAQVKIDVEDCGGFHGSVDTYRRDAWHSDSTEKSRISSPATMTGGNF